MPNSLCTFSTGFSYHGIAVRETCRQHLKGNDMMIRDFLNTEDEPLAEVAEAGIFFPSKPVPPQEDDCKCDLSCVDDLPLASMYAPMQKFRKLYSPQDALRNGTLYQELNLPFRGGR